ncbi:MAG: hypothetical protein QNJ75_13625 [Acidimicrobiia bacterium]|nr:hypothetical protein [Acidimicrobiia bacterium]
MLNGGSRPFQPTLLGAAWRFRWIVLIFAVIFAAGGYYYGSESRTWTGSGSVTVQDPQAEAVFGTNEAYDPKRHVSNQAAIIESYQVASLAAEILADGSPAFNVPPDSIQEGVSTRTSGSTDVIRVFFVNPDPDLTIAAVNAVLDAYGTVQEEAAKRTYVTALAELDAAIEEIDNSLAAVTTQVSNDSIDSTRRAELEARLEATVTELLELDVPGITAEDGVVIQYRSQVAELETQIATLRLALSAQGSDEVDPALTQEQAELRSRLEALRVQRDELAVNADIAGNGVAFVAEATEASPSSVMMLAAAGAIFGAGLGAMLAFYLAARRRHFFNRSDPAVVLGTSLLADIPDFAYDRLGTELPVQDRPDAAASEAFRFVATAMTGPSGTGAGDRQTGCVTAAVVAPSHRDGTTTVVANTALAAAYAGWQVAVVDADFATQALVGVFADGAVPHYGLTDLALGDLPLAAVGHEVAVPGSGSLVVYGRGHANPNRSDFFASPEATEVMDLLRAHFDLILVDTPPPLRVAVSSSAVRQCGSALVVIRHGANAMPAAELRDHLGSLSASMLGYVYNRGPLRREMARTLRRPLAEEDRELTDSGAT